MKLVGKALKLILLSDGHNQSKVFFSELLNCDWWPEASPWCGFQTLLRLQHNEQILCWLWLHDQWQTCLETGRKTSSTWSDWQLVLRFAQTAPESKRKKVQAEKQRQGYESCFTQTSWTGQGRIATPESSADKAWKNGFDKTNLHLCSHHKHLPSEGRAVGCWKTGTQVPEPPNQFRVCCTDLANIHSSHTNSGPDVTDRKQEKAISSGICAFTIDINLEWIEVTGWIMLLTKYCLQMVLRCILHYRRPHRRVNKSHHSNWIVLDIPFANQLQSPASAALGWEMGEKTACEASILPNNSPQILFSGIGSCVWTLTKLNTELQSLCRSCVSFGLQFTLMDHCVVARWGLFVQMSSETVTTPVLDCLSHWIFFCQFVCWISILGVGCKF